jgi:hypothetical protein
MHDWAKLNGAAGHIGDSNEKAEGAPHLRLDIRMRKAVRHSPPETCTLVKVHGYLPGCSS